MSRRWRPWAWGLLALAVFAIATALASPTVTKSVYDPQSAAPEGTRALAELLRGQGLTVERTTDAQRALSAAAGQTLVVAYPQLLPRSAVRELESSAADVVLLAPVATPEGYLGVVPGERVNHEDRLPACDVAGAISAGSARSGGVTLVTQDTSQGFAACYPASGTSGPTMLQATAANGSTQTVFGSAEFMTNEWLDDSGNAALAMNVIGANPDIVWWLPSPVFTGTQPLTSLLPDGVWPVLAALVILVVAMAAWQGRRLGPVVLEPLPVAVKASETTEGRARIYQRHKTRAQAAHHLRALAESDLAQRLGLPAGSGKPAIVSAVSDATGRSSEQIAGLLYGPPPERDDDLVTLGRQLADLDLEVRRS
ncbi:MAG: DUF4350 domain-containing protein [Actinomycetes bacterium]